MSTGDQGTVVSEQLEWRDGGEEEETAGSGWLAYPDFAPLILVVTEGLVTQCEVTSRVCRGIEAFVLILLLEPALLHDLFYAVSHWTSLEHYLPNLEQMIHRDRGTHRRPTFFSVNGRLFS